VLEDRTPSGVRLSFGLATLTNDPGLSTLRKVRLPNFFVSMRDVLAFFGLDF
jgi:hypothetical protein